MKRRFSKRSSTTVSSPRTGAANVTKTRTIELATALRLFIFFPFIWLKKNPGPPFWRNTGLWIQDLWPLVVNVIVRLTKFFRNAGEPCFFRKGRLPISLFFSSRFSKKSRGRVERDAGLGIQDLWPLLRLNQNHLQA